MTKVHVGVYALFILACVWGEIAITKKLFAGSNKSQSERRPAAVGICGCGGKLTVRVPAAISGVRKSK
ncbi:hypothetical protein L208DRAFT_1390051 [Tricholoma matsutake]|nr:hypothetical protein L208DRAFT_1390051 [Tricholoma matsutake 945]